MVILSTIWLACGFNLPPTNMNDVDAIYAKASAKRVPLIRVAVSEDEILSGRARERFPTGAVLICRAESFETACRVAQSYGEL